MQNNPFFRDPRAVSESLEFGRIGGKKEATRIRLYSEPNFLEELKLKHNQLVDKLNSLLVRPESDFGVNGKEKKEYEIAEVRKDIADIQREIEKEKNGRSENNQPDWIECPPCGKRFDKAGSHYAVGGINGKNHYCSHDCAKIVQEKNPHGVIADIGPTKDYLQKENQELRQELAEVKKQLSRVLEELKKLKNNVNGKDSEKLNQQIVRNEKLIKEGENVPLSEVQEQVNKSQALMKEFDVGVSSTKDDKGNGSLPYVIGGLVILAAAGIIGYFLLKKNKRNK